MGKACSLSFSLRWFPMTTHELPPPPLCHHLSVGKQCIFPFKFQGVTHNGCADWIYGGEHQGSSWCSTKVDANGDHLDGVSEWGICPDSCSKHNSLDFL